MPALDNMQILERYAALGPDFATWLLVHARQDDAPAPPSEPGLKIGVLGPLVLEADHAEATKITLSGDEAAAAPEVDAALRTGKRIARARFEFTAQDATWVFTLEAETFDLKSVKVPVPKIPDLDEYISQRVQALQHLARLVDELYEIFLSVRLDPQAWKEEVEGWLAD